MIFPPEGTPKNLEEALIRVLCQTSLSKMQSEGPLILKDFIAQKFNIYMFKYPEHSDMLKKLFDELTKEMHHDDDNPYHDLNDAPEHYPEEK